MNEMNRTNVTSLANQPASHSVVIDVTGNGRPPLRIDWVERIFAVLSAGFGRQFADQWAGVDPVEMKSLWAKKLRNFYDQPEAISGALEEATNAKFPPNVGEFREMCRTRYVEKVAPNPLAKLPEERKCRPDIMAEMLRIVGSKRAMPE